MKNFLRMSLYQTMRKRIDESKLNIETIEISAQKVSCFQLSSNLVLSFEHEGELVYFRECLPVLNRADHFRRETEKFFKTLPRLHIHEAHFKQKIPIPVVFSRETVAAFRGYIDQKEKPEFWEKLGNADMICAEQNFSIWTPREYDKAFFKAFGLTDLPKCCYEIAVYYLWCMRGACYSFKTLSLVRGKQYSYFSAVRAIASCLAADALGLGYLLTCAKLCRLVFEDGTSVLGVISNAAPGSRMVDSDIQISGSLQKELIELSFLDMICMQTDHGPNNYNVEQTDGTSRICAFDNDNPNTFLPLPVGRWRLLGCAELISTTGLINRPHVSGALYSGICNVDMKSLKQSVKPYLNVIQTAAMAARIKKLRKALKKTAQQKVGFILADWQWNAQTVAEELSGGFGKTYLTMLSERKGNTNECI